MPAALRKCLILELDRPRPRALEQADCPTNVQRVAISGIGINDKIGANAIADRGNDVGHFVHRNEADVGAPKPGIGNGGPGDIES